MKNSMAFEMYPNISGKSADPVREVVIKYIDFFVPDASGTSTVAIDNKIEQAMDLVKSHLMIAVREEVEVLKEKISELSDKINQLEVENTILKANMSQETLQQLQMQTQLQITGNGSTPAIQAAAAATPTTNGNGNIRDTATDGGAAINASTPTAAAAASTENVGMTSAANNSVETENAGATTANLNGGVS